MPAAVHRTGSRSPSCTVRINDRAGTGVRLLAQTLRFCYEEDVSATVFDSRTKAALQRVQRAHGITADGVFGPATLKVMNWRLFKTTRPGVQSSGCYRPFVARTIPGAPAPGTYSPYCGGTDLFRFGPGDWTATIPAALSRTGGVYHSCYLKPGDYGPGVKALQLALRSCYRSQIASDGRYGRKTQAVVKRVQQLHGLRADGIYGPATLTAMKWRFYLFDGTPSPHCSILY